MHNAHGDVIDVTNGAEYSQEYYFYNAFGTNKYFDDTCTPNKWGYCDQLYDFETGNYYMRARYYHSETGRFINEDPIKDGSNWYAYCGSNPINYQDPNGLATIIFALAGEHQPVVENATVDRLGDNGEEVFSVKTFSTGDEFIREWEETEMTKYDDIIIHMHGNPSGLSTKNSNDYTAIIIPELAEKTVNSITLISCNTGFIDQENNVAEQFYNRMDVNFVVAPDGSVYDNMNMDETDYLKVEAYNSTSYRNLFKDGKEVRESLGFLMYYKDKKNNDMCTIQLGAGPYYPEKLVQKANISYNKVR